MKRAISMVWLLVLATTAAAEPRTEPAVPVDALPARVCDVARLPEDPVLHGRLAWSSIECLEQDPDGRCRRCGGEPVLVHGDAATPFHPAFQLGEMRWNGAPDPASGEDCASRPPYQEGGYYAARIRWPEDLSTALMSGTLKDGPARVPVMLLNLPLPAGPAAEPPALSVGDIPGRACDIPERPLTLRGTLAMGPRACTKVYCPDGCCNECLADAVLTGERLQVTLAGIGCGGNECAMSCQGLHPGDVYDVTGTLRLERGVPTLQPRGAPMPVSESLVLRIQEP